jgi:hypothetical protein
MVNTVIITAGRSWLVDVASIFSMSTSLSVIRKKPPAKRVVGVQQR